MSLALFEWNYSTSVRLWVQLDAKLSQFILFIQFMINNIQLSSIHISNSVDKVGLGGWCWIKKYNVLKMSKQQDTEAM